MPQNHPGQNNPSHPYGDDPLQSGQPGQTPTTGQPAYEQGFGQPSYSQTPYGASGQGVWGQGGEHPTYGQGAPEQPGYGQPTPGEPAPGPAAPGSPWGNSPYGSTGGQPGYAAGSPSTDAGAASSASDSTAQHHFGSFDTSGSTEQGPSRFYRQPAPNQSGQPEQPGSGFDYAPPPAPGQQHHASSKGTGLVAKLFDFSFSTFITPSIITIVYMLAIAWIVLSWLIMAMNAFQINVAVGVFTLLVVGPLFAALSVMVTRVVLEFFSAVIRLAEDVGALRNHNEQQ